jgi:serine/threonine-protein kinase
MVMEHLSGVDLGALTRTRGPLPIEDAVEYVLQACEAVAEAHAKGIIHRDLKPSNLFLTKRPDGSPLIKVLDFGIAKVHEDETEESLQLTTTGMGMGSPQFMSPEQLRDAKMVDVRTDVWSLGVVLYQLLSGTTPFQGKTFSSLCATIAADLPVPLRQLRPDVPEPLADVVMRCLEKDVGDRVPNVAELARGLAPHASSTSTLSVTRITKILAEDHGPKAIAPAARAAGTPARPVSGTNRSEPLLPNASSPTLGATLQDKVEPAARASHRPTLLAAVGGALCMGLIMAAIWVSGGARDGRAPEPAGVTPSPPPAAAARPLAPVEGKAVVPAVTSLPASPAPAAAAAASAPPPASANATAAPVATSLPGPRLPVPSKKGTKGDPLDDRK